MWYFLGILAFIVLIIYIVRKAREKNEFNRLVKKGRQMRKNQLATCTRCKGNCKSETAMEICFHYEGPYDYDDGYLLR